MALYVNGTAVSGGSSGVSLSDATPQPTGSPATADPGVATSAARADHVHAASVAAADITDAGAAGIEVVQAGTAAEVRATLGAYAALSDSGWTETVSGTATASRTGGVTTLTADSGGSVLHTRAADIDPACPAIDVIARLDYTSGAPASASYVALAVLSSVSATYGWLVQVDDAGLVRLYSLVGGTPTSSAFGGAVSLTSGETWLRLVVTPGGVARAYYGTGSGSTPPTSWTYVGGMDTVSTVTVELLTLVGTRLVRTASGSGTYTVTISDLRTRTPGLSP